MGIKLIKHKLPSVPFLEHLLKFHLDLCIPRYSNYPKVSCLGMNPGIGWNPYLEESYLPEYRDSKSKTFRKGTSGIYLHPVKVLALEHSPI